MTVTLLPDMTRDELLAYAARWPEASSSGAVIHRLLDTIAQLRADLAAAEAAAEKWRELYEISLQAQADAGREQAAAEAERDRSREALTPSTETKAAYMGEFKFPFPILDLDGREVRFTPNVPWVTIKEIMAAILARAALQPKDPTND